jgi:predicted  nucleic acid-binding Zn-ribbon protein
MSHRDLEAEINALQTRQAQLERCLAALQEAVTEITDELDPPSGEGRDLMRVFGEKVRALLAESRRALAGERGRAEEP